MPGFFYSMSLEADIAEIVSVALREDGATGDVTAELIATSEVAKASVVTRQSMTMAGSAWFDEVYRQLESGVAIDWRCQDGDRVGPEKVLCTLRGPARALVSGERTALNFLQLLSGTATTTAAYVDAVADTGSTILDTRKTVPALRSAQKYAVRCGGGTNHRMGLADAILIKENHLTGTGGISAAIAVAKRHHGDLPVEVEVESLQEMREALEAHADRVLLDNFSLDDLRQAVTLNTESGNKARLEASGGVTLDNVGEIAATGVDYISVGALTKDVIAIDLSMRFN